GGGARVVGGMRAGRGGRMGKVLEAARIQGSSAGLDFDLAGFIADLRAEALALRTPALEMAVAQETVAVHADVPRSGLFAAAVAGGPLLPSMRSSTAQGSPRSSSPPVDGSGPAPSLAGARPSVPPESPSASAASILAVTRGAERLFEQGRLAVPPGPRLGEESLFGFSIRELSSPDPSARSRAAERLRTLADRAAAPAVAVALHAERDETVLVALLEAFRAL